MTLSQSRGVVTAGAVLIAVITGLGAHSQGHSQGLAQRPSSAPSQSDSNAPQRGIAIGDTVSRDRMHLVTRPGAYGLSTPPAGNGYAIVSGHLVRIDTASGKILSALRRVENILD